MERREAAKATILVFILCLIMVGLAADKKASDAEMERIAKIQKN